MSEYERLSKQASGIQIKQFGVCKVHKSGEFFGLDADTCSVCGFDIRSHPVDLRNELTRLHAENKEIAELRAEVEELKAERLIVANNIAGSPADIVEWSEKVGESLAGLGEVLKENAALTEEVERLDREKPWLAELKIMLDALCEHSAKVTERAEKAEADAKT